MIARAGVRSAILFVVAFLLITSTAWGDSQARIVRLSLVEGDVEIDRGDGPEYAILNMPVLQGAAVAAPEGAHAEIEFEEGSTIRLADYSQVTFEQLSLRSSGGKVNFVRVDSGTVYFRFRHVEREDDIRVVCGGTSLRVQRSSRFRVDIAGGGATIAVFSGRLELEGATDFVEIKKGETLRLDFSDQLTYAKERGTESLPSDDWESDREREYSEYAGRGNRGYEGYGAGELNRYGEYVHVNGYGYVWRPYGVSMDWDPFGSGLWATYPGCGGYTWVSPYAWGWAPYRFGRWVWVDGMGWVWWPGARYTWSSYYSWNCGPTVYGYIPPTYVIPVTPTPRDLPPRRGTRPPRVVVVGNPPNVRREWTSPGRPFPGGTTNSPVAVKPTDRADDRDTPRRGATTNTRSVRTLDDGEVFVRDKVLRVKPSNPLDGATTNAPGTMRRPVSPTEDIRQSDRPVRRVETPRPEQPRQKVEPGARSEPTRVSPPATTNAVPAPRAAPQPRVEPPPARSAPPPARVDPPARSAPAPSHTNPAPAPRSSSDGGFSGGRSSGGHNTPAPSAGHKK